MGYELGAACCERSVPKLKCKFGEVLTLLPLWASLQLTMARCLGMAGSVSAGALLVLQRARSCPSEMWLEPGLAEGLPCSALHDDVF